MVHKRIIRKQQDTSRSPLIALRPVADAFNAAVARSVADADPEAVHRVRTGSRRLQALIEAKLREADLLEGPARACLRPIKQIRRAAATVRDLDVQRKLLEKWMAEQPASPLCLQAKALDTWLRSERKHLAHGMQKQIRKRQQGLAERQAALFTAVPPGRTAAPRPADTVALEAFVHAADAMPLLHAENLHEFRKAAKKARYVAESGGVAPSDVAKALKQIQDAIGDWHDWLCLSEDAKAALGQDAAELTAALRQEVAEHFAAAMETTQRVRSQLLGEWMAVAKRPPAVVAISSHRVAANRRSA